MEDKTGGSGEALPLCKCRVLYIGTALPTESSVGVEAVQKPFRERYISIDDTQGIDSRLIVYSNGIQLQYVSAPQTVIWFPISSLRVGAAVKCVNAVRDSSAEVVHRFVAMDALTPNANVKSPPMFGLITRRIRGIKVLECHCFITKSDEAAMALVNCCTQAYESIDDTAETVLSSDSDSSGGLHTTKLINTEENNFQKWMKDHEGVPPDIGGYFLAGGEKYTKRFGLWLPKGFSANRDPNYPTLRPRYPEITSYLPENAIPLDHIPPSGTLPPGARVVLAPAALVVHREQQRRNDYRPIQPHEYADSHVDSVSQQGTTKKARRYKKNTETRQMQRGNKPSTFQTRSFGGERESMYRKSKKKTSSNRRRSLERHRHRSPSPSHSRRSSKTHRKRSKSSSPVRQRPMSAPAGSVPPETPPPDYDNFEEYWFSYNRTASGQEDNRRLSKQFMDTTIDNAVQKEFVLRDNEFGTSTKRASVSGDRFTNQRAFARSIQQDYDFGSPVSAYDLVKNPEMAPDYGDVGVHIRSSSLPAVLNPRPHSLPSDDHVIPFSKLNESLGYIP
ncbi:uncharacterized protein LOC141899733 [Tubulanus polymorphus]|uniref:uncharacterized protein LOC141899733 n=1 Tax=Tubulanus polymorphus TaxID=672921 RepID=UPI003DA2ED9D